MIQKFRDYMENYELTRATRLLQDFCASRGVELVLYAAIDAVLEREKDSEKLAAYQTARTVLMNIAVPMAPAATVFIGRFISRLRNET